MSKITTLCLNVDFRRAYYKGRCYVSPALITYVRKNKLKINRIGITTSKKTGIAVKRNRARRIIRSAYTCICSELEQGYDIVFVARAKTAELKSGDILLMMQHHLADAGILNNLKTDKQ